MFLPTKKGVNRLRTNRLCTNYFTPNQRQLKNKMDFYRFDYIWIQNNQNRHSVIRIHLEMKCTHICASTTHLIVSFASTMHYQPEIFLSLCYSYEVLKQLFFVISEELSLACTCAFLIGLGKVCTWDGIHLGHCTKLLFKGTLSTFGIQIVQVCKLLIWSSNQNCAYKNRQWCMVRNYIPGNCTCKMGVLSVGIVSLIFLCAIFGGSTTYLKSTHVKWVLVTLDEWNPFLRMRFWVIYVEFAHTIMGDSGIELLEPIFACTISRDSGGIQLHAWKLQTRTWVVVLY